MKYINFRTKTMSGDIGLLFENWTPGEERLAVFSPHDDDAVIGAGYAALAAMENGGEVFVVIFCNGDMGYSNPADKGKIAALRRVETANCYRSMGVPEQNILYMGYNDFSVWPFIGHGQPDGSEGATLKVMDLVRRHRITRVLLPNGWREHLDHEAVFRMGAYDAVQAGDRIGSHHGKPQVIKSYLQYSVWSDFSPEDSLMAGGGLRANRAVVVPESAEEKIGAALREYVSQGKIIEGLITSRAERATRAGRMELYIALDPRPKLDFGPYRREIENLVK